jgi:peptidoglycan hydrolase-like protein with peptidoglycan-binding domain
LLGFIYQPEMAQTEPAKTEPKQEVPAGIIRKGMNGSSVKWLQTKLYEKGYLRKNEIDGDFGTITEGAVLAFKADNGLLSVCGDDMKEKL